MVSGLLAEGTYREFDYVARFFVWAFGPVNYILVSLAKQ